MTKFTDSLRANLTSLRALRMTDVAKFAANLTKPDSDPAYHLVWSDDAFKSAAAVRVIDRILANTGDGSLEFVAMGGGDVDDAIKAWIVEQALSRAADLVSQSTSTGANAIARLEAACWAEAAKRFDHARF